MKYFINMIVNPTMNNRLKKYDLFCHVKQLLRLFYLLYRWFFSQTIKIRLIFGCDRYKGKRQHLRMTLITAY